MTQHLLLVDGYNVGDRLLEGAMFKVRIDETDGDFIIRSVEAPDSSLRGVDYSEFFGDIRQQVQENLDHLRQYAKGEGRSLSQEFDIWERDTANESPRPNRIDLLNEI